MGTAFGGVMGVRKATMDVTRGICVKKFLADVQIAHRSCSLTHTCPNVPNTVPISGWAIYFRLVTFEILKFRKLSFGNIFTIR